MVDFTVVGREVPVSDFMWNAVYGHVSRLDRFFNRIIHCEVGISSPHRHHHKGKVFHIRVHLKIPGQDIVVNRETEKNAEHEDFYLALNDVFKVVTRKLQDYVRRMRTSARNVSEKATGVVVRLFRDDGYGFIETPDLREVYFHENSLIGARFKGLQVGERVWFHEEMGHRGPQASSVHVL